MFCEKCGDECFRDSVDVGVGVIHGPYGCPNCGWSEDPEYDLSNPETVSHKSGWAKDQYGGLDPPINEAVILGRFKKVGV